MKGGILLIYILSIIAVRTSSRSISTNDDNDDTSRYNYYINNFVHIIARDYNIPRMDVQSCLNKANLEPVTVATSAMRMIENVLKNVTQEESSLAIGCFSWCLMEKMLLPNMSLNEINTSLNNLRETTSDIRIRNPELIPILDCYSLIQGDSECEIARDLAVCYLRAYLPTII